MNEAFAQFMAQWRSPVLTDFFIFVTGWGLLFFLIGISLYLLAKKQYRIFLIYLVSTTGAWLISEGLKIYFKIPRPISDIYQSPESYSFPSGHATAAFALWPLMAHFPKPAKWTLRAVLLLFPLSRLYLGVHFLTDILAGAVLGLAVGYWARWIYKKNGPEFLK